MKLLEALVKCVYPTRCPFCGTVLEPWEEGMCGRCQTSLPWTGEVSDAVEFCQHCFSPLWYEGKVRRGILCYKFWGGRHHARLLGRLMGQCLLDRLGDPVDLITWVPLSTKRLGWRGYDQAQLLAECVGEVVDTAVSPTLTKVRDTRQQSKIHASSARRANVTGAYCVTPQVKVEGKRVVLVDDVTTSGATLSECAACLRIAGAQEVIGLTLARAR